jgi:hypothetical protein
MKATRLASIGLFSLAGVVMLSALTAETGCSSTLAQPFEQMKGQPITIHRLQNFEPPAATPAAPGAAAIPGIPPQIQQWVSGAASMLPPGLIPPGLIPGTAPMPAAADAPKFYNFRILGSVQVTDSKMRDDINELFGKESNFEAPKQSCMYAEFGFSIGAAPNAQPGVQGAPGPAGVPADVLVSLSCNQVQLTTYAWPYGSKTGLTADTSKKIVAIVQKAFGG